MLYWRQWGGWQPLCFLYRVMSHVWRQKCHWQRYSQYKSDFNCIYKQNYAPVLICLYASLLNENELTKIFICTIMHLCIYVCMLLSSREHDPDIAIPDAETGFDRSFSEGYITFILVSMTSIGWCGWTMLTTFLPFFVSDTVCSDLTIQLRWESPGRGVSEITFAVIVFVFVFALLVFEF